jgi:hypothetical protein
VKGGEELLPVCVHSHVAKSTPLGPFPIEPLGPEMQGPEECRPLAFGRCGGFGLRAFAKPAALDVGFIGKVRLVNKEDFYCPVLLAFFDGRDNFCHPRFFCSAVGASRGSVLAKRL